MINLIPQKAKRSLVIEYWTRVISVWLIICSIALLVGAIFLLPTQVLIGAQISIYEESSAAANASVLNYENVSTQLVRSSQQARMVLDESEVAFMSEHVDLLASLEGGEIKIGSINISREEESVSTISLSGEASNRQSLASFRDRIIDQPEYLEADLPLSNLAQDKDILFNITIVVDNKPEV